MAVVSPEDSMARRATLTAVLFALGKFVLGLYLGSGAAGPAYGAASSLITLLWWITMPHKSCSLAQSLLSGLRKHLRHRVEPQEHAIKVDNGEGGD
jgi:membrane protein